MMLLPYFFMIADFVGQGMGKFEFDPCSEYSDLPDVAKRSPLFMQDAYPLCDRYLLKNWYRAGTFKMPTEAPGLVYCGTLYPYWMNDKVPEDNNITTVIVCQVGFQDKCVRSHKIRMKNCKGFYVYELTSLPTCNSAYCFEEQNTTACIDEVPSGLSVTYHNVSWTETNDTEILSRQTPTVNLICNFSPLNNDNYLYQISWYIDAEVIKEQTVTADERENAILSAEYIVNADKKAGCMIHCVVGAKISDADYPCRTASSPLFFAGIKVEPTNLIIERGKSADLTVQLTIPYADYTVLFNGEEYSPQNLYIQIAEFNDSSKACRNETIDTKTNQCETRIPTIRYSERDKYAAGTWKQSHTITIYNKDDGDYRINKHMTLRLSTKGPQSNSSKIFDGIFLPDIPVYIEEPASLWKGKKCKSQTDPNLLTFDEISYQCQLIGTFILYKNELYNQEVQEKHFSCHPHATCNCAVAVRSGRDVFTIDICNGTDPLINFPYCEDKVLNVKRPGDRQYLVILPTGTLVSITIARWSGFTFLNTLIMPSPSDVNNTQGLCGNLDGDSSNDFTGRDGTDWNKDSSDEFSRSWMVSDSENLLMNNETVYESLPSILNTMARVCYCLDTTKKIVCEYGLYKDCKFKDWKQLNCILNPAGSRRRKRDLTHIYSKFIEKDASISLAHETKRHKRQTRMSFKEAKNLCQAEFQKSVHYLTCQQNVWNLGNSSLQNCISDLHITGDLNITFIHINAALEECKTLIMLNSTFQETNPEVTYEIQMLCPSSCSGNGFCNQGNCNCQDGFAGTDCSFDLQGPPVITHISDFGLCDKSEEDCNEITLFGGYFVKDMNTTCHTKRQRLSENGSVLSTEYFESNLTETTLYEGFCPLVYSKKPAWRTHFIFNISYGGQRFSENYNVYTYQSLCQEVQNTSGEISFTLKDGFCFVDGMCIGDGNSNPNNLCDTCDVLRDRYSWTVNNVSGRCFINGKCISSGGLHDENKCKFCDPTIDINSWQINPDYCLIDNVCYFDGEWRESDSREICNITVDRYRWSTYNKGGDENPCSASVYTELPDLPKRNPSKKQDSAPLCDRYLIKKWYRGGFSLLARKAPALVSCGTLYPYWMKGEHPASGTTETVTVCQVGFESDCVKSHTIQMRNCGSYAVYELTPLDACNSAYCFTDIQ